MQERPEDYLVKRTRDTEKQEMLQETPWYKSVNIKEMTRYENSNMPMQKEGRTWRNMSANIKTRPDTRHKMRLV